MYERGVSEKRCVQEHVAVRTVALGIRIVGGRVMTDFNPDRRRIITGVAGATLLSILSPFARSAGVDYPFTLGVASGDPLPDGFVIWTRLVPKVMTPSGDGGLNKPVEVRWKIASDAAMAHVVRTGQATAHPRLAHSVHIEVSGLQPGRPYWYQFESLGAQSAVGQACTAPLASAMVSARFGFVSCSHWEAGYFSAYRHLAAERPDLVFFLGDYIYESNASKKSPAARSHATSEPMDLAGYRNRYAQYKTDPDLQALHACAPSVATWDDHEVQNDYAAQWSQDPGVPVDSFLRRRAAAYQAFYEHMPLRASSLPKGPDMRIYRNLDYGRLARFHVLDGRQYRSEQPCIQANGSRQGHVAPSKCTDPRDPKRTMLGWQQEAWLDRSFARSPGQWNVIAQDLLVAPLKQRDPNTQELGHWTDGWDGYMTTRERMLASLQRHRTRNPVFWGGDIHSFWTTDLHADADNPDSAVVATEFVGTSVTSSGPSFDAFNSILGLNPHVKFFDSRQRGYVAVDLSEQQMLTRFQVVSDVLDPAASVSTLKRFTVEAGKAGAVPG
ncbi:Phosphodiesterase/alkaline phosphatase D [Pseudomonas syringae pv. tagetis]|uniref:Phosphodiesterase/alkaline phosphatase D n=2 Tax=Pseudomonas syringae pv. tagetis TaxID=129140 RepID=A0A0Q0BZC7_9PSED|nr:Phosphodiesterase/alkaline phosphatase D [Pseudomonas syringae pv. tagetis]RMW15822.1 Phosphodiesterase/alkaline phosphatase D [Pseudomonas syringae pv. tagetis]RMW26901.1 Phosphodiesterase/alkaline phosphatase D [Pseudomonas syringae pv. tagetis]